MPLYSPDSPTQVLVSPGAPTAATWSATLPRSGPTWSCWTSCCPAWTASLFSTWCAGHSAAGVLLLTARDGIDDRLRGLHSGADDYLVKPFVLAELVARVTAVLRRLGRTPSTVDIGDLTLDGAAGTVQRGGRPIELTGTERRLLEHLAAHRDQVLSKTQLLTAVWGYEDFGPNLVEVHISALRRKLGEPRLLHTVRGLGYVLRVDT